MDNDQVNKLLVRIGNEDQAAFRELYKAFSRKVYAYVLNMLNDHARAEEVVADTLYEVWRNPHALSRRFAVFHLAHRDRAQKGADGLSCAPARRGAWRSR